MQEYNFEAFLQERIANVASKFSVKIERKKNRLVRFKKATRILRKVFLLRGCVEQKLQKYELQIEAMQTLFKELEAGNTITKEMREEFERQYKVVYAQRRMVEILEEKGLIGDSEAGWEFDGPWFRCTSRVANWLINTTDWLALVLVKDKNYEFPNRYTTRLYVIDFQSSKVGKIDSGYKDENSKSKIVLYDIFRSPEKRIHVVYQKAFRMRGVGSDTEFFSFDCTFK